MITKRKIDTGQERQLIIGMAVSTPFLNAIKDVFEPELLQADISKVICRWCLDHYQVHGKAPGKLLQDVYEQHIRDDSIDDDHADDLAELLDILSKEYERANEFDADYYLKQSKRYLDERRTRLTVREAGRAVQEGEFEEAQAILEGYKRQELVEDLGFNPFTSIEKIQSAFESFSSPFFTYPGALGQVFNNQFSPATFVTLLAPPKRGKTWWLDELAFRAHRARNRVALFQIGDLSEEQQIRRLHVRLSGRSYDPQYCGPMLVPILDCAHNQSDECDSPERVCEFGVITDKEKGEAIDWEVANSGGYCVCTVCKKNSPRDFKGAVWYKQRPAVSPLTWREGILAGEKWMRQQAGNNDFRVVCRSRMNTTELRSILDIWNGRGWRPHVIVIDYLDLLELSTNLDVRHRINETWRQVRQMSIDFDCCVVGATQSDAGGMEAKSLGTGNFSENVRKWDHVTAAYGINQTPEEKRKKIVRIAPLLGREGLFDTRVQATVLQCLEIGRPYLGSYF